MKDIYIYMNEKSWNSDKPELTIFGDVISKDQNFIEIHDEKGYTKLINIQKVLAIVY